MSAKLVKWNAIRNIQKGGTAIAVSWAEKTTGWERPTGFPAPSVKEDFVKAVENNKSRLPPGTAIVAMKESEHQSDKDKRMHYTAFCKDKDGNDLPTQHLVRTKDQARRTGQ